MRVCNLLLGPSAFCLLAGVLGLGISCRLLGSSLEEEVNAGKVGLLAAAVLLSLGGLSLAAAFALAGRAYRRELVSAAVRWTVVAAIMMIPTALLFGTTGGFPMAAPPVMLETNLCSTSTETARWT